MQMKMPKNNTATSMIAPNVKLFATRTWRLPNAKETATKPNCTNSRR